MTTKSQRYNCFTRNGGNAIPKHAGLEVKGSNPTAGLTLLWARNPFRGNFHHWQVSRKDIQGNETLKHYSPTGRRNPGRPLKRLLDMWDRNGSTSGPTPWEVYDDNDDDDDDDDILLLLVHWRQVTVGLDQCFSTAGPRPGTGPRHQLYRAARDSPGIDN